MNQDTEVTDLLAVFWNVPDGMEDELDEWYQREHIPERLVLDGFLAAERFQGTARPGRQAALWDLSTADVLEQSGYRALMGDGQSAWTARIVRLCGSPDSRRVHRGIAVAGAAPELARLGGAVWLAACDGGGAALAEWLRAALLPRLVGLDTVLRARSYAPLDNASDHLLVVDAVDEAAFAGPDFLAAQRLLLEACARYGARRQVRERFRRLAMGTTSRYALRLAPTR
jgi:hypothetical protein